MPGCVKHSLHEPHAPENLDEELLGKHERAYAVDNDWFETLWLLQHAASVSAVWWCPAPAGAQSVGRRHPKSAKRIYVASAVCSLLERCADKDFR